MGLMLRLSNILSLINLSFGPRFFFMIRVEDIIHKT